MGRLWDSADPDLVKRPASGQPARVTTPRPIPRPVRPCRSRRAAPCPTRRTMAKTETPSQTETIPRAAARRRPPARAARRFGPNAITRALDDVGCIRSPSEESERAAAALSARGLFLEAADTLPTWSSGHV